MKPLMILIACVLLLAPVSQTNAAGGAAPGYHRADG
jgi:hypothetical protein